jgi:RND family efflux transporter MFP subunit
MKLRIITLPIYWALLSLITPSLYANATPSLPFPTAIIHTQTIPQMRTWTGTVEASKETTVSAQTSGKIMAINYDIGDYVPAGSMIIQIDDTAQRARYQTNLANVESAKADLTNAQKRFQRIQSIVDKGAATKQDLDNALAARDVAQSKLDAAQSALKVAEEELSYTRIIAPYAGVVTERYVEVGESVTVGSKLMSGYALNSMRVNVDIPQGFILPVKQAEDVRVQLTDGQFIHAQKVTFFPYANPKTKTFQVRIYLPEEALNLFPGMSVKVTFQVGEKMGLLIPQAAVIRRGEVTAVYVLTTEGKVALRQLRLGKHYQQNIEVLAGLEDGETIALDPIQAALYRNTSTQ